MSGAGDPVMGLQGSKAVSEIGLSGGGRARVMASPAVSEIGLSGGGRARVMASPAVSEVGLSGAGGPVVGLEGPEAVSEQLT